MISQIIDQLAFFHFYQNYLSVIYMNKYKAITKIWCQNFKEDLEENLPPNIHH